MPKIAWFGTPHMRALTDPGEAQLANTRGIEQDAPSRNMTAHRTSGQVTDTRTHESQTDTPTPRGDTPPPPPATHVWHRHSDRTMIFPRR